MQEFQDVLDGKIKVEDLSPEKLPEFRTFALKTSKEEIEKVAALREAKRVENERVESAKAEADRIKSDSEKLKAETMSSKELSPEMKQFRSEQVEKAKERLFSTVKLSEEEKKLVLENFSKLDSGKMDADFIYKDLVSAVAASNPDNYLTMSQDRERMAWEAEQETLRQAAAGITKPSETELKKFTDEALKLSKEAGITPEAATKQLTHGNKRVY